MKPKEVATLHAKKHFLELLEEVQRGRRFYITRHGKRIAELAPLATEKKTPKFGCGKGVFVGVARDFDAPLKDLKSYSK